MNRIIVFINVLVFFIFAFCYHVRQILIGIRIIKSKKYTEEKELKKQFFSGIICLVIESVITFCFVKIMMF